MPSALQDPIAKYPTWFTALYPTKEEFEEILRTRSLDLVVNDFLFTGLPFLFSDHPAIHNQMLKAVAQGLSVPPSDICVVGSARVGFSLSPFKFGQPFDQGSDLDIIVVSPSLFDVSWLDILTRRHIGWRSLSGRARNNLTIHQEKHYVYRGWIYPDGMTEVLKIGQRWLTTFNGLSRIPYLSTRNISGRLYRTWEHAKIYHQYGLSKLRDKLVTKYNAE